MRYFDHDTTASGDDLILALRIEHGGAAVDCYWAILEQIYREESPSVIVRNRPETQALCARLALGFETVFNYVSTMVSYGLLEADETGDGGYVNVISRRAMENVEAYQKMCEKNRANGAKGGRKPKRKATGNQTANQVETQSDATGGDKKRKEKKVLGLDKTKPNTDAEHGADAGKPAPRSARRCAKCGGEMRPTNSFVSGTKRRIWRCEECDGEEAFDA